MAVVCYALSCFRSGWIPDLTPSAPPRLAWHRLSKARSEPLTVQVFPRPFHTSVESLICHSADRVRIELATSFDQDRHAFRSGRIQQTAMTLRNYQEEALRNVFVRRSFEVDDSGSIIPGFLKRGHIMETDSSYWLEILRGAL